MARIVTHQFTLDSSNIYIVNNGVVTKESRKSPVSHYADSGPNVGYLSDNDSKCALRIKDNSIERIDLDAFMELRKNGKLSPTSVSGVISIEYDADVYTDHVLRVSTQYKLADRNGTDFQDVTVFPKNVSIQNGQTVDWNGIPLEAQNMARTIVGHNVTVDEIEVYRRVISAVDKGGRFLTIGMSEDEMKVFDRLRAENFVAGNRLPSDEATYLIQVSDINKRTYMRMVVELYDSANVKYNQSVDPVTVAAAAMNMSIEERERIGLVNRGVPQRPMEDSQTNRRFGSGEVGTALSIHRPEASSIGNPVIVNKTPAAYTAAVLKAKFTPYSKPAKYNVSVGIDKRIPMYAVPMLITDNDEQRLGYAYLIESREDGMYPKGCTLIAAEDTNYQWIFYEIVDNDNITFYPDILAEVISRNKGLFPDIDLSGKVQIALKNFKRGISNISNNIASAGNNVAAGAVNVAAGAVNAAANAVNNAADRVNAAGADINSYGGNATGANRIDVSMNSVDIHSDSAEEQLIKVYTDYFEQNQRYFYPFHIDWSTGFIVALSAAGTPVLLMATETNGGYIEYPRYTTVIPVTDTVGFAVVGLSPSEVRDIEQSLVP